MKVWLLWSPNLRQYLRGPLDHPIRFHDETIARSRADAWTRIGPNRWEVQEAAC